MTMASDAPLLNLSDIAEIELFVLKRLRELTLGDHASAFSGPGFNFVGLRDWEPGDRVTTIDWAQSSLSNFSPMITRQYDQNSTATIVAVADASMSTRCGPLGVPMAATIARAVAAIGLSAVFCQDLFGLITFDEGFRQMAVARPRIGKSHLMYCLDLYDRRQGTDSAQERTDVGTTIEGHLRKTSVVPVISDFLFADAPRVIGELSRLNARHDVFLAMVDTRPAFELPAVSAGWVETIDIETGRTQVVSRREFNQLADRMEEWQRQVAAVARDRDLDVLRVGSDRNAMETTLVEFMAERRLRHVS